MLTRLYTYVQEHGQRTRNIGRSSVDCLTSRRAIGQGAYGKVYEVEHREWGILAYKQLSSGQFIEEQLVITS
jgi:hypothetical protein